jgi:hypothetical protein
VRGVLGVHVGVHVGAEAAAIDLTGAERHQVLRHGRQHRVRDHLARRTDVPQDLARGRVAEEVQASVHVGLLLG